MLGLLGYIDNAEKKKQHCQLSRLAFKIFMQVNRINEIPSKKLYTYLTYQLPVNRAMLTILHVASYVMSLSTHTYYLPISDP